MYLVIRKMEINIMRHLLTSSVREGIGAWGEEKHQVSICTRPLGDTWVASINTELEYMHSPRATNSAYYTCAWRLTTSITTLHATS